MANRIRKFIIFYEPGIRALMLVKGDCAKEFLNWVATRVDDKNIFHMGPRLRMQFAEFIKDAGSEVKYSDSALYAAIRKLIKVKMLIKRGRSIYQINPRFIWSSDAKQRIKAIEYEGDNSNN